MLVLTRKVGERVLIGKDIVIEVTRIGHGNVRLAFQCPQEVVVLREEVADELQQGETEQ